MKAQTRVNLIALLPLLALNSMFAAELTITRFGGEVVLSWPQEGTSVFYLQTSLESVGHDRMAQCARPFHKRRHSCHYKPDYQYKYVLPLTSMGDIVRRHEHHGLAVRHGELISQQFLGRDKWHNCVQGGRKRYEPHDREHLYELRA